MILCFSGTGNSLAVARELVRHLGQNIYMITDLHAGERSASERFADEDAMKGRPDTTVVWVFPIYSWGLPGPVKNAISSMMDTPLRTAVHHMVATCGDDAGLADRQFRRLIADGHSRSGGCWTVEMPNTYTMMKGFDVDSPEVTRRKLQAMPERVRRIADEIHNGIRTDHDFSDVVRGSFAWLKSKLIYPWFMRYATVTKPFHATEACIGCGLCARQCPARVITMVDGRPQWTQKHCYMCERCYHSCPFHAIAYGKSTDGKGQYLYNKIAVISTSMP